MYSFILIVGFADGVNEQAGAVDGIEFVGLATEITRYVDAVLFVQDRHDFVFAQHAQHVGDTLMCAGAMPAYPLRIVCNQVFFPQQTVDQGVGIGVKQFGRFDRMEQVRDLFPGGFRAALVG